MWQVWLLVTPVMFGDDPACSLKLPVQRERSQGQLELKLLLQALREERERLTREVPSHRPRRPINRRNPRIVARSDDPSAVLVDLLEHETRILPSSHVVRREERVLRSVELADGRMEPVSEVVGVSVDDERSFLDGSGESSVGGCSTDGFGEAEGEETDGCHEEQDERDETHLLSPGSLSFPSSFA